MSWSGTVTCSHCYQRGHNKRKCPQLTEQIKDKYEGNSRWLLTPSASAATKTMPHGTTNAPSVTASNT
jgi:hypothetical protein